MSNKLYFAYGSNINLSQMAYRCPDAKVVEPVVLEGYELLFRGSGPPPKPNEVGSVGRGGARERCEGDQREPKQERTLRRRGCGVATIAPKEGSQVHGLLWRITPRDEQALDFYEGYPHLYDKQPVNVTIQSGAEITVMAYVMTREKERLPTEPTVGYYEGIREGFVQNSLPVKALEKALRQCWREVDELAKNKLPKKKKGRDTYER